MIVAIIGIVLLVNWLITMRIEPEKYPNINPEKVYQYKLMRIKSSKIYALLYFIFIAWSLSLSFLLNHITKDNSEITFLESPLYFKAVVIGLIIFLVIAIFKGVKTRIHQQKFLKSVS